MPLVRCSIRTFRLIALVVLLASPHTLLANPHSEKQPSIVASEESLKAWQYAFSQEEDALLDDIQRGAFLYFWNEVGHPALLVKDKRSAQVCSVAAVGFQLSALPIGVERGWITKEQGAERAKTILRTLIERDDNKKYGVYFHFVDHHTAGPPDYSKTKHRYEMSASTIDHALFQAGAMTAAQYFDGEVATLVDQIIASADWARFPHGEDKFLSMGWRAETDKGVHGPGALRPYYWKRASDEERLVYFMAVGTPVAAHQVSTVDYYRLQRAVMRHDEMPPFVVSWNGSLFTYFFSHCWINYRNLSADDPSKFGIDAPRVDWFENSRRAVLTHRQRCIEASDRYPTLGPNRWGLAPCSFVDKYPVHEVGPNLIGKDVWFDGILPPYGAGSSIMFAPEEAMAALVEYRSLKTPDGSPLVWRDPADGGYGFVDSFRLDPPHAHDDYLGIDQGPMLLAIENARTGLIWKLFMDHPAAKSAVERLKLAERE